MGVTSDAHTRDSELYALTIHHGMSPRERKVLAAVLDNMPCTVSAIARLAEFSRRTAQRACEALADGSMALLQRTEAGVIIDPEAIGGVEAWADRHGPRSGVTEWWEDPEPTPMPDGGGYVLDRDAEPWPADVFPERAFDPLPGGEEIEMAVGAVESRRVPMGKGSRIPFAVLNYVTETNSLQAVKVAVECGRRANRQGVAEFQRGELAEVTGLSSQQVSNALNLMRREGIAASAASARVELNLRHGQEWAEAGTGCAPRAEDISAGVILSPRYQV